MSNGTIADWVGIAIALFGASSALAQYVANSNRTRAIRAADEIDALLASEAAKIILKLLDWESAHVAMRDETGTLRQVYVNEQNFLLAIRVHTEKRSSVANYQQEAEISGDDVFFLQDEENLRDLMDQFLSKLQRIESLMKNGIIKQDDFDVQFCQFMVTSPQNLEMLRLAAWLT